MSDDLAYLTTHLPAYGGYADEADRHDTDMRVRAFVGEQVTDALTRFAGRVSPEVASAADRTLLQCMFTDQTFIRRVEHARLDAAAIAALVTADRRLVETAAGAESVGLEDLGPLLTAIDRQFELRYEPLPATI
jgi:hypothetical protein